MDAAAAMVRGPGLGIAFIKQHDDRDEFSDSYWGFLGF